MSKERRVWVSRPKNDTFRHAMFTIGLRIEPDVCDTSKWCVTSTVCTYHERFDSRFAATVWAYRNCAAIYELHKERFGNPSWLP